jgi:mitochondrial inner membrane protease subunit 1
MALKLPLAIYPPALFFTFHALSTHYVHSSGPSMLPTIPLYSVLWLDTRNSTLKTIKAGDVVAAKSAWGPIGDEVLKRIVGLEGDFVEVSVKKDDGLGGEQKMLRVPKGHVWLEGDNKPWSLDSRHYGPVPRAMVYGKAVACKDARGSWLFFWLGWRWVR